MRQNAMKMLANAKKKGFQSIEEYIHQCERFRLRKLSEGFTRATIGDLDVMANSPPSVSQYSGEELKTVIAKNKDKRVALKAAKKAALTPAHKQKASSWDNQESGGQWSNTNWDQWSGWYGNTWGDNRPSSSNQYQRAPYGGSSSSRAWVDQQTQKGKDKGKGKGK